MGPCSRPTSGTSQTPGTQPLSKDLHLAVITAVVCRKGDFVEEKGNFPRPPRGGGVFSAAGS